MGCERIQELLSAYAEDMLSPDERGDVEAHVAACDSCAGELASLRAYFQAMHGLPRMPAPPDFVESVNRRLDAPPTWLRWVAGFLSPLSSGMPLRVAGLVASVLVVILVHHQMTSHERSTDLPAPVARSTAEQKPSESEFTPTPGPSPAAAPTGGPTDGAARAMRDSAQPAEAPLLSRERPPATQSGAARDKAVRTPASPKRKDEAAAGGSARPIELTIVLAGGQDRGRGRMQGAPMSEPRSAPSGVSKEEKRSSSGTLKGIDSPTQASESLRTAQPGAGVASSALPAPEMGKTLPRSTSRPGEPGPDARPERQQEGDQPGRPGGRRSGLDLKTDESRPNDARTEAGKGRGQPAEVQRAIDALRRFLSPLSGRVVSIERAAEPSAHAAVTVTIPASQYPRFVADLASLGQLRGPPPRETDPGRTDTVSVRIILVTE